MIVVLGHKADDVSRQMRTTNCRTMLNPRYAHGRAGSLRIGAKAVNRDADAIVITDVDSPRPASFLRALIDGHRPESAVTRPVHDGHRGRPNRGWRAGCREKLMAASDEDEGLHGVLRAHAAEWGEVDAGELLDLGFNTPRSTWKPAAGSAWTPDMGLAGGNRPHPRAVIFDLDRCLESTRATPGDIASKSRLQPRSAGESMLRDWWRNATSGPGGMRWASWRTRPRQRAAPSCATRCSSEAR